MINLSEPVMSAYSNNNQGRQAARQAARQAEGGNQEGYYLSYPLIKKRMKSTPYMCIKCDEPFRRVSRNLKSFFLKIRFNQLLKIIINFRDYRDFFCSDDEIYQHWIKSHQGRCPYPPYRGFQ